MYNQTNQAALYLFERFGQTVNPRITNMKMRGANFGLLTAVVPNELKCKFFSEKAGDS